MANACEKCGQETKHMGHKVWGICWPGLRATQVQRQSQVRSHPTWHLAPKPLDVVNVQAHEPSVCYRSVTRVPAQQQPADSGNERWKDLNSSREGFGWCAVRSAGVRDFGSLTWLAGSKWLNPLFRVPQFVFPAFFGWIEFPLANHFHSLIAISPINPQNVATVKSNSESKQYKHRSRKCLVPQRRQSGVPHSWKPGLVFLISVLKWHGKLLPLYYMVKILYKNAQMLIGQLAASHYAEKRA